MSHSINLNAQISQCPAPFLSYFAIICWFRKAGGRKGQPGGDWLPCTHRKAGGLSPRRGPSKVEARPGKGCAWC
ncbi:hypothetical protein HaLaN_04563 [Haematococcus lacustris]|uniref:Uncharacterized protein n=1 Tax=Haematococcus lacustris TaxID=44745 RepID=A0A699YJJ9_HAELA|nr:hypothetical protein HaLaN_04563 [Haematococcus lacustris]